MRVLSKVGGISMNRENNKIFSNYSFENWKNLSLFAVFFIYLILFGSWVWKGSFTVSYGWDYLAFWSVGKIADERGFSEIYDLDNLRWYQLREVKTLGLFSGTNDSAYLPIPAPLLSLFVVPFKFLSKLEPRSSYWIWTLINLMVLIGYMVTFLRKINPQLKTAASNRRVLIPVLLSFTVFNNIVNGQVEVFTLVCAGEFIRNSLNKKPFLSGVWLGGLLLKPQLLILIIPYLLILRYWKVVLGFITSSGIIFLSSLFLSGVNGMKEMITLWTRYSTGIASNNPEFMINWRMVGVTLTKYLNLSCGWIIAGSGMILTLVFLYFLIKHNPPYGSPQWILSVMGVFSATLALTWHSHYYLVMVLIPFFIFALAYELLPQKLIFFWTVVTPFVMFGIMIFSLFLLFLAKINVYRYEWMLIGISGFIVNLVIYFYIIKFSRSGNGTKQHPINEVLQP